MPATARKPIPSPSSPLDPALLAALDRVVQVAQQARLGVATDTDALRALEAIHSAASTELQEHYAAQADARWLDDEIAF